MTDRIHNFSAGPAVLPEPVLRKAQEAIWNVAGSGIGIVEHSHRGKVFDRILDAQQTDSIIEVIREGAYYGMQTFDQALVALVREGLVREDDAKRISSSPHDFSLSLRGEVTRDAVRAEYAY